MCEFEPCNSPSAGAKSLGEQQRRQFLAGVISLPLASILGDIPLAQAQAQKGEMVRLSVPQYGDISAYFARSEQAKAPVILLIHEWWGLNNQIKIMAEDIRAKGFHALAIDLFKGSVATTRAKARTQTSSVNVDQAHDVIRRWVSWAKSTGNGKIATIGWCFGGGWSLQAALRNRLDAAIIYYGRLNASAEQLAGLKTPLLGHFGVLDKSITPEMVGNFQKQLRQANKQNLFTAHWYTADHAFANPSGGRYDQDDALLAWARSHSFLVSHLG